MIQVINNTEYELDQDYVVDNYKDSWAMYAYEVSQATKKRVMLRVIPPNDIKRAIDIGEASKHA